MKLRLSLLACFMVCLSVHGNVNAATAEHTTLKMQDIGIQLPIAPVFFQDDQMVDIKSLQALLPITVEVKGEDRVLHYKNHQLYVQPGRVAAMLDGKWLLLKHSPLVQGDALLLPNRQVFDLLNIRYRTENGKLTIDTESPSLYQLQRDIAKLEGAKARIGYIGILQPNRWIIAIRQEIAGKPQGFGNLYEASREIVEGGGTWKLTKLRTISDTAAAVFLEWMPNGSIFENIVSDRRPEFLFIETCNCAGRYQYGTMFTVTEMGLVPVWHSQATYERVQKADKGWVLVTHRKDSIPTRTSATMPYWEIHETWNGQSFMITKQEYRDPLN